VPPQHVTRHRCLDTPPEVGKARASAYQAWRVVRVLGAIGEYGGCAGRDDGLAEHAPAGVAQDGGAEALQLLGVPRRRGDGEHVAPHRQHDAHLGIYKRFVCSFGDCALVNTILGM